MKYLVTIILLIYSCVLNAQEPTFTQYFQSPLLFNPAAAGSSNVAWRLNNIFRQQSFGSNASYNTIATSFDGTPIATSKFGVGALFLSDQTIGGVVKSTIGSANLSYSVYLDEEQYNKLSIGFAAIYGSKKINFSNLTFSNQFITSGGFDQTLSSGEGILNATSSYLTSAAGLIYSHTEDDYGWEIGISGYNLNKVKLSLLSDSLNYVPQRYSAHSKILFKTSQNSVVNFNVLYQTMNNTSYYAAGAIYTNNYFFLDGKKSVSGGILYNNNKIITPYFGIILSTIQLSITYDIIMSESKINYLNPKTWEISLNLFSKK